MPVSDAPEMQTRKLQKVGGSTYTVSVPKRWAREHDLDAGDEVHLYGHDDGSLVVRGSAVDGGDLDAVRVAVESADCDAVERALRAAYASGFEEIELVAADGFSTDQRRTASSLAKTLVGTEVVAESDDRVVVHNLLDSDDVSVRQSLIQLKFVALSMHRSATAAATGRADADHVPGRDDEADRLFAMITRHFERSLTDFEELDRLGVDRTELFEFRLAARQLERVADHAVEIARTARTLDSPSDAGTPDELAPLRDDLESVADASRRIVEDATDAVLDGDAAEAAHDALDLRDETVADAETLNRALFERDDDDAYRLTTVVDSLVRTAECGGNVAEIAVQSSVRGRE
ncbi:phosphate signaling complex PhoU family protein [Halorussus halobius]|uniref:phosphate signaling complex PhoU family protein n=1 Tax=Halorussus halobius TaxID=1710537 RepID=UPI001091EC9F|nr:phosphate uptake regulator PhoU [Halorussus halobius]